MVAQDRKEDLTNCFESVPCSEVVELCQITTLSIDVQTCKLIAQLASRCIWQRILAAYLAQKYHKSISMRMTSLCQCLTSRTMPPSPARLTTCRSSRIPTSRLSNSRYRSRTASETRTSSARQRGCIRRVAAVVATKGWQLNRHPPRSGSSSGRTRRQLGKRRGRPLR